MRPMTVEHEGRAAAPTKRKRALVVLAGTLALLAALWSGLWIYFAHRLESGIARWAEQRRAHGWTVTWQTLEIGGFPLRWEAHFSDGRAVRSDAAPGWFWHSPGPISLRYRPWQPRSFALTAPGQHRFGPDPADPDTATDIHARSADGRMEIDPAGRPLRLELALGDAVVVQGRHPPARLARLNATLSAPAATGAAMAVTTGPHLRPGLHVQAALSGLTLPEDARPVLGREIARAALDAIVMGRFEPGTLAETLTVWRDDGGTVEIANAAVAWGPLSVDGEGTLALDDALQPQAAFSTRIAGYAQTVDALVRAGLVPANAAFLTKLALGALAKTPDGGGAPRIEVPLTVQERKLYIGPVSLFTLPAIDWSRGF